MGFRIAEGNPVVKIYPEAASQSFVAGDLVYLVGGKVTVIAADTDIMGIAGKAASTTTDTEIPVYLITPEQTIMCETDVASAVAYVGEDYGLNITSGSMSVNIEETSTTSVTIIDLVDGVTALADNPRVLVKFHTAHLNQYTA